MLVIPVILEVVVVGQLGKVAHLRFDVIHVQFGVELDHGRVGVGIDPVTLVVALPNVAPHVEASCEHLPPWRILGRRPDSHGLPSPANLLLTVGIGLILLVVGGIDTQVTDKLLFRADHLPEGVTATEDLVEPLGGHK